jgi:hypothetical protein
MPRVNFPFKYVRIYTKIVIKAKFLDLFAVCYYKTLGLLTTLLIGFIE